MSKAKPEYAPEPLTLTWAETAWIVFRKSEQWLRDHIADYPDFPLPHKSIGLFSREQVKAWQRKEFGEDSPFDDAAARLIERAQNGKYKSGLSRR